ncbi:MAG: hypothetical protein H7Y06_09055 [Opitutaceae bacterium]|nr:hypothetical protein [Opitutaceae bacterium]
MSIAEVKERIAKMNLRQRREIQLYLIQLRSETPAWKKETARRNRELAAGKGISLDELKRRLRE